MRQRRTMQAYYGTPPYGGSYQPASFMDSVGQFFGNLGNNWAGGSDAPMYADPNATMANPGGATAAGAYNAGQAVGDAAATAAQAVLAPVTGFAVGVLQRVGVVVGVGIIAYTLLKANNR